MSRNAVRMCALGLVLGVGLAACTEGKSDGAQKPDAVRAVVAQQVKFEPLQPSRTFVGTVRPRVESDLAFRVGGKVAERFVQAGERVAAGDPLARLDETDLALQREQAAAEVQAARASLTQAEAEDQRIATLRREGWSTASAVDRQRALVEEARGRLNRAERALSLSANNLAYATLRADAAGVVTLTSVEAGQVVSPGQPAVRVARLDSREAVIAIPEALIDRARSSKAGVSLWSEPGKSYAATLRELSPTADPATRTYQARFTIQDAPADLEFGLTAGVTLSEAEGERAARLPLSALYNDGSGPAVFVVNPADGALALRKVRVQSYETRDVLIRAGLSDGEMVVTLGVQKLDVGQKVRLVQPQS